MSLLYHLANALAEESVKQVKHDSGQAPDLPVLIPHRNHEREYLFAVSFKLTTYGERGRITYIVTIAEVAV